MASIEFLSLETVRDGHAIKCANEKKKGDTDHNVACHTHSPKAGQGMNVSMMDSYNLSWKLAHSILGLTPQATGSSVDSVLETFELERVDTARQLIEFDAKFSHMFSGKMGAGDADTAGLTHGEFLKVFRDGSGFTSGCGLEYKPSKLVRTADGSGNLVTSEGDPLYGALTTGRRVLNVELKRYADNTTRQLQDGKHDLLHIVSD